VHRKNSAEPRDDLSRLRIATDQQHDGGKLMPARAIWNGVIRMDDLQVPVKLYSAVSDRTVHFRLLHRKDQIPVRQELVNPDTDEIVPFAEARRAYVTDSGDLVLLDKNELEDLAPPKSRDIEILYFLDAEQIDHRWYDRPYYLGPDRALDAWQALIAALQGNGKSGAMVGVVRWTMRNQTYNGVLHLYQGYPMLMSLRHAEEVVSVESLDAPSGKELDERELAMARQLIAMLEAPFEPEKYKDEYRERLMGLIEIKQEGGTLERVPPSRIAASSDLGDALKASLEKLRRSA
jgi:DNA end-binding protein Ku